ncbi:hypothetical protein Y1Q_0006970 [Alligator mississippiensis]|uniref:Reverse transcriptase domain-containing protein n=1 Tax=Alligator mississippiensis TaxID=8496 RepID=A0A151PBH0_ALLMI|nr:hypothetical protein Y1Q_0006970 [Alligator mississippiensis]
MSFAFKSSHLSLLLLQLCRPFRPKFQEISCGPGGLDLYGQNLSFLAYADDLVLLASDTTQLQQMLDATSEAARWMGLCFNVTKCASLHIDGRQKSRVLDSTLMIQG